MDFESYLRSDRAIPFEDAATFHSILRRPPVRDSAPPEMSKEAKMGILKLVFAKHAQGENAQELQAALMTDPQVQQALDYRQAVAQAQHSTQQLLAMQQQMEQTQQGMQQLQQQTEQMGQQLQQTQQENSMLQEQLQGEMQMRQQSNMQAMQAQDEAIKTKALSQKQRHELSALADNMSLQLKQVAATDPEQQAQQEQAQAQQQQMAQQEAMKAQMSPKQRKEVEQAEKAQQQAQVQGQQAEQALASPDQQGPMQQAMQQQAAAQQPQAAAPQPPQAGGMVAQSAAGMGKINVLREKLKTASLGKCAKCGDKVKRGEMMKHTCSSKPKLAGIRESVHNWRENRAFEDAKLGLDDYEATAKRYGPLPKKYVKDRAAYEATDNKRGLIDLAALDTAEWAARYPSKKKTSSAREAYKAGRVFSGANDIVGAFGRKMPKTKLPKKMPLSEQAAFAAGAHRDKLILGGTAAGAAGLGYSVGRKSKENPTSRKRKNAELTKETSGGYSFDKEASTPRWARRHVKAFKTVLEDPEWLKRNPSNRREIGRKNLIVSGSPEVREAQRKALQAKTYNDVGGAVDLRPIVKVGMVPPPTSALKARLIEAGLGAGLGAMTGAAFEVGRQRFSHAPPTAPTPTEISLEQKNRAAQIRFNESPSFLNHLMATKSQAQLDAERDLKSNPKKAVLRRALQGAIVGSAAAPSVMAAKRNLAPRIMG